MITLALDISTHATGVAIFQEKELIYYECIFASSNNVFNRIDKIRDRIEELL